MVISQKAELQSEINRRVYSILHRAAKRFHTPSYVIFEEEIIRCARNLANFAHRNNIKVFYAVKAYPRKFVCRLLNRNFGFGVEASSMGEIILAIMAGVKSHDIIFNSNGKSYEEVEFAIGKNIYYLNCDSVDQFELIRKVSYKMNKNVRVVLRFNPDVDPKVHPYIATSLKENKFGMFENDIKFILNKYNDNKHTKIIGLHIHLGSNIKDVDVFKEGFEKTLEFMKRCNMRISLINIGGGFGVQYKAGEDDLNVDYVFWLARQMFKNLTIFTEPGRFLVAKSAYLLGKVLSVKETPYKKFTVIDASMTENIRPALYEAYHPIYPLYKNSEKIKCDIVSSVCESSDFQAKNITIPRPKLGNLIAIGNVGAYSIAMASNYNGRVRPSEILVTKNGRLIEIVPRETYKNIIK